MKEEDLDRIELPWNLDLDNNQKKTLLRQQPLLIDGLAGTGKTSVLAYRSAMRTARSSDKTNILVCASKSHVVKRMLENHGIFLRWGQCAKQRSYQIMKANHAAPRNKNGGLKQPNLAEACNYFDVPLPDNAHRALDDARATAHLVCAIHRAALET